VVQAYRGSLLVVNVVKLIGIWLQSECSQREAREWLIRGLDLDSNAV
jgi:hypothetical protein